MIIGTLTPAKQPNEKIKITVNFLNNVPSGGSVSSAVVTSRDASDDSDSSSTIISGSPTVSSPNVTQLVQAGTDGDLHIVTFKATMSNAEVYEDEVMLPIKEY